MAKPPPKPPPGISLDPPDPRLELSGNARWVVVLAMAIEVPPGRARVEDGEEVWDEWGGSGLLGRCKPGH